MASNNSDDDMIDLPEEDPIQAKRRKKGGRVSGGGESAVWNHFSKNAQGSKCKYFFTLKYSEFFKN